MAISGDTKAVPGLKLETTVFVDNFGRISTELTKNKIIGVSKVIDGSVEDILHLIGYQMESIAHLLIDGIIKSTEDVNSSIKDLPLRRPASYLIQENDKLFGVIIDSKSEARIAGLIRHVIPQVQFDGNYNAIKISKDNTWDFCNSQELYMSSMITGGDIVGMIGTNGFFFLQTNVCHIEELPQLILIREKGCFIIEKSRLVWTHSKTIQGIGRMESVSTHLETEEFIVSIRGGCLRSGDAFELIGSGSAIIGCERFSQFLNALQISENSRFAERFNFEEIIEVEDNEESDDKFSEVFDTHCKKSNSDDTSRNYFSHDSSTITTSDDSEEENLEIYSQN